MIELMQVLLAALPYMTVVDAAPGGLAPVTYTAGANCTIEGTYKCINQDTFQQCRLGQWSVVAQVDEGTKCDFHDEIGWQASSLTFADVQQANQADNNAQAPGEVGIQRRDQNFMVPEPRTPDKEGKDCPKTKRQIPIPGIVLCPDINGVVYVSTDVSRALNYGKTKAERSVYGYPKEYFARDPGIDYHGCSLPMWEYPLMSGYTFGDPRGPPVEKRPKKADPGKDRIIFNSCGQLCAVVSHRGFMTNQLQQCYGG